MKRIILACSLAFLLTGCSGTVDSMKESVLGYDWDSVIDNLVDVAVDSLLGKDGSQVSAGNQAPTPPAVLAVPEAGNSRYWNDIMMNGTFPLAVFGDNVVTLGGGWEVSGFIIGVASIPDVDVEQIFQNPNGWKFTYEYQDYDMEQNLIHYSYDCVSAGTSSHDSIYFQYTVDGETQTRAVTSIGLVTDENGWFVSEPTEYVTFYVPFGTNMVDNGKIYTNIADFHTSREEEYWHKRVYGVEVQVSGGIVTSLIA